MAVSTRVLLLSDSHGRNQNLEKVIRKVSPIDLLLFMGDLEGSEGYLDMIVPCPAEVIAGDSDYFSKLPREKVVELGRHRVFMTHGNNYGVNFGLERLMQAASERDCDYVFFGHTHRPVIESDGKVTAVNPGSISIPRQDNKRPSYAIASVDRRGDLYIEIFYM